ncbi:stressosome-associated protein Prli42 [Paenibacillus darwinianus]|nr:stressosome-associated protein Prli42 [Paenibacillus darwinianus]
MPNRKWIRITALVLVAAMVVSTLFAALGWLFY